MLMIMTNDIIWISVGADDDHFIAWTLNSHKRLRMALMGVLPRRWARAIIESRFFFQLWLLICLVVPNDEDQTFADDIDHSSGGVCWWFPIQFPWLGSLNGNLCSQVPKVPSPSLHSCNVKSVPRCSTRAHTCVQAWTMQHFWSYKCSKNRIPVIWYFILMNFNFFFLFIATLFTLYVWIKII